MSKCPACLETFAREGTEPLAEHFEREARASDAPHVRWLNQNLSRKRVPRDVLTRRLTEYFRCEPGGLTRWIKSRFIARFYGPVPHPFVRALQRPSRAVLLGYVIEHQHFLRQWVRSCAYIAARTSSDDVVRYELDNLLTEFGSIPPSPVGHYELLLRMGESLGIPRGEILATAPLPATRRALAEWDRIASGEPWVEAMAAMHGLELIASRNLVEDGATVHYFDPEILESDAIPAAAQAFLREGYEADVGHSEQALALVESHARTPSSIAGVQSTFLRSIDLFDDYLIARLERGSQYGDG